MGSASRMHLLENFTAFPGHPYLLEEFSKSHTTPMDPQHIAAIFVEINVKLVM